jgi:hypothetical protein
VKKKAVESRKLRRGKSAAKQFPSDKVKNKNTDDIFGFMAGKGKIVGDVVSPAFSPEEWGDLYFPPRPRRPRRLRS